VTHILTPAHRLIVDARCFPTKVLYRTCYAFTDRCYIWLEAVDNDRMAVSLTPKDDQIAVEQLPGEFGNALIDYALRAQIAQETAGLRDSLVSAAMTGLSS
jgi:His-Xaa-Ser system protein HxsD